MIQLILALMDYLWLPGCKTGDKCSSKGIEHGLTHSSWAERVQRNHLDWRISFKGEAQVSVFLANSYYPWGCPTLLG